VRAFVDAVLANRDAVAAFLTEGRNLPERDRAEVRRMLRGYVAEWVRVVTAAAPGMDERAARVRVHGAFAVINDLARSSRYASRPMLAAELHALALAVLAPVEPAGPPE
jgi:hypothetical protein